MKPANFPARKLMRQLSAKPGHDRILGFNADEQRQINEARLIRTKIDRRGQGRISH